MEYSNLGRLFLRCELTDVVEFTSLLCFELTMQLTQVNDLVLLCWTGEVYITLDWTLS